MPDLVLADHLFGRVNRESAAWATSLAPVLQTVQWATIGIGHCRLATSGSQGGGVAVAESLGSEQLSVARTAMDLAIWSIASLSGVQRAMALGAVEALLVPHRSLGQLLLGRKHGASATRAALTLGSHNRGRVRIVEWSFRRDLILAVD